jgi:hypothetical protein
MSKTKKASKVEAIKALRVAKTKAAVAGREHLSKNARLGTHAAMMADAGGDAAMARANAAAAKAATKPVAAKPVPDDLLDPAHPLNRTNGKSKAEIAAKVDELIARDKSKHVARGVTSPAPKPSTLTEADHKAIAELQAAKQTDTVTAKKEKPAKEPRQPKAATAKSSKSQKAEDLLFSSKKGVTREELEKLTGWPTGLNMPTALQRARKTHPKCKLIEQDGRFRFVNE